MERTAVKSYGTFEGIAGTECLYSHFHVVNVVVTTQLELKRTSFEVLSRLAVDNQLYLFGTKLLILVGCGAMALCQHVQL